MTREELMRVTLEAWGRGGRTELNDPEDWGGCPDCHESDGFIHFGRDHWLICKRHRVRWWAGSNLLSYVGTAEDQQEWQAGFGDYIEVEPWYPDEKGGAA